MVIRTFMEIRLFLLSLHYGHFSVLNRLSIKTYHITVLNTILAKSSNRPLLKLINKYAKYFYENLYMKSQVL